MVRAIQIAVVLALGTLASSCMSFNEVQCSDGHLCPPGSRCDDINGGCILASQIQACSGLAEGANCQIDGADGTCTNGACVAWRCGDNRLNPGEACDHTPTGPDFGGMDCTDFGFRNAEGLQCTEDCRINKDNCTGGCGDKVRDQTELCDGPDIPAGTTCQTLGFYDAPGLQCSAFCTFDVSKCTGFCGDGELNGPEQCDGGPAAGESCLDYSFDAGRLGCTLCAPGFEGCTSFGWNRATVPTTQRIRGIWGTSSKDFYAVGAAGTLLHSNGSVVAAITPSVTSVDLNAIWGNAATNIYAVGAGGTIVHYDGTWTSTTSGSATLGGIWGAASNDIYAVGLGGTILHYTNAWSAVTGTGVGATDMRAVWGSGSDVFIVGASGTVAHYNGSSWTTTAIAGVPELFSVWGTSPTNVFASGNDGAGAAAVYHYTGSTWTSVYSGSTNTRLGAVFGSAANDAFSVGNTMLHHDGTAWSELIAPPEVLSGTKLWAGWVSPTGDVWAGGDSGYLAHWGGASWTAATSGTTTDLRSISAWGSSDAITVGFKGSQNVSRRYDGTQWTTLTTPTASDNLYSVWASGPATAFAVGEQLTNAGVYYYLNGTSWTNIPAGDAKNCSTAPGIPSTGMRSIWGPNASNLFAVGANGAFRKFTTCWSTPAAQPPSSATATLFGISGTTATSMYAVETTAPKVYGFDGASWTTLPAVPAIPSAPLGFTAVWNSSATDVFAVGDAIVHYDGSKWSRMTPNGQVLTAVSGTGPRNVFAAGTAGRLLHYDGISWTPIRVPVPAGVNTFLRGVAATALSVIVVGDGGFVQRLSFSLRPSEVNCRDGWDDDGDGMPDCADSDCAGNDYCKRGGACTTIKDIACGATITGTTLGRSAGRDFYTCDANPETGPEAIYRVVPPANGTATATLSAFAPAELDLVVVGSMAATDGCDPDAACRGASSQDSTATEAVSFSTTANRPAFIIVEGRNAAAGPFSLQVTCP